MATAAEIAYLCGKVDEARCTIQMMLSAMPCPLKEEHWEEWGRHVFTYQRLTMDEVKLSNRLYLAKREVQTE